jgi:hypothetical protein
MARKFFYVAAGMLMLALSYHLGARTAMAQGGQIDGGKVLFSGIGNGWRASGVVGRDFCVMTDNGSQMTFSPPIPGTQPILDTDPMGSAVLLGDGEVLKYTGSGWVAIGNILPGPVPALHESWGQLKSRYAPKSAPTSQTPTNR